MTPAGAPLLVNQNLVYTLLNLAEAGSHPTPDPIVLMLAQPLCLSCATVVSYGNAWVYRLSSEYKLLSLILGMDTNGASFEEQSFIYYGKTLPLWFGWRVINAMPMWNNECSLGTRICCTGIKINVQYKGICMLIYYYPRKDMLSELFSVAVAVSQRRTWSSSCVLAGHYVVNQKYVVLLA